jgi:hypothetical protein
LPSLFGINNFYCKRGIFLFYLNLNIFLTLRVFILIVNWDHFLYNSKFQFASIGLNQSFLQISSTPNLPNVWLGLDFFNLYLILLTSLIFSIAILAN